MGTVANLLFLGGLGSNPLDPGLLQRLASRDFADGPVATAATAANSNIAATGAGTTVLPGSDGSSGSIISPSSSSSMPVAGAATSGSLSSSRVEDGSPSSSPQAPLPSIGAGYDGSAAEMLEVDERERVVMEIVSSENR